MSKWLDSIEKQKRGIDLKEHRDKQTDAQTDRVNDKKYSTPRMGAEINRHPESENLGQAAILNFVEIYISYQSFFSDSPISVGLPHLVKISQAAEVLLRSDHK